MDNSILDETDKLFKRADALDKFSSKYNITPCEEHEEIMGAMKKIEEQIKTKGNPENQEGLLESELKRRLNSAIYSISNWLEGKSIDFKSMISLNNIPEEDISGIKPWLESNKQKTEEAIKRLVRTKDVQNYELMLPTDIPRIKRQAEEFAEVHIRNYHRQLGRLVGSLTNVGEFLRDIDAVATTKERSYYNPILKTLAISIPGICYINEDSSLQIREGELIRLFGHEGMGHALNDIITNKSDLPYFMKSHYYPTRPTSESVAQFYQKVILDDLKKSPETLKELGIKHKFEEIYEGIADNTLIEEYRQKLFYYSIIVLANQNSNNPNDPAMMKKGIAEINKFALDPFFAKRFVEERRYSFDSEGNLPFKMMSELIYCAQPVQRALREFEKQGIRYDDKDRSRIDSVLLKGLWTPIGYVDNARISAKSR